MHVAVVGAGPAGAWTAYELARRGARVTIFDPSHPREKPCGGGVTGRAIALVAGAVDASRFEKTPVRSARFVNTPSRGHAVVPLDRDALWVTSRAAFDAALLEAARGAGALHVAARVVDLEMSGSGVRLRTANGDGAASAARTDYDFVVGADGANSLVRRRVAQPFRREQLSIATGYFVRGSSSDEIVLEMTADPPGYIWSFPRPDHLAVGICAQADAGATPERLRARTAAWIREAQIAPAAGRSDLAAYSWPIPSLAASDGESVRPAGARWCLVGDAAGLVDPITREGIYFALASGAWAAEALAAGPARFADEYVARVRDVAVAELTRAARLKARFFRPAFTGLMMRALEDSAAVRSVMADLIAGTQSYRTLKRRLLGTLELGLAWRAYFPK